MASVAPDFVDAQIGYLVPTSLINRRFVAPGAEHNTGVNAPQACRIRNARNAGHDFTLAEHGFALARYPTALTDPLDPAQQNGLYADEVARIAMELTGADLVLPLGAMVRHSQVPQGYQPPAADAHVDLNAPTSHRLARMLHERACSGGPGYDRFILFSLWRCLSPGPQDWPIALCEFDSAKDDTDYANVKIDVDEIPRGDALFAPIPGEEDMNAASIFMHNPAHRWWYFPDMDRDEVLFITFHDSDHSRAWRCLHTAFHDRRTQGTLPRESIEFRACAYFTR
jgi:hypothetical protein